MSPPSCLFLGRLFLLGWFLLGAFLLGYRGEHL